MMRRIGLFAAVPLLLTACVLPDQDGSVRTDTTASVAFQPGVRQIQHERGLWGTQPIVPPAGLVTVRQGDLIGRTVEDGAGTGILWVEYLLADPQTGDARYAICSSNRFGNYVAVPLSAMQITPNAVAIDANERSISLMPQYSLADLHRRYPPTTISAAPASYRTGPMLSNLPPAPIGGGVPSVSTAPMMPVESLQLVQRGSVVGYPVIDAYGQTVGTVDAVSAVPATGEVRYVIVSSPMLGMGTYIAVPASSAQASGGRVLVPGATATWMQGQRYRGDQVQQRFGTLN